MAFRVAIIGDSAMWGQGLIREHTFAYLASSEIASSLGLDLDVIPGRSEFEPARGEARSGAKINARGQTPRIGLTEEINDDLIPEPGDRAAFLDGFPLLFRTDPERIAFRDGVDDSPAARLYGDHPATFPTITDGVRHLAGVPGAASAQLVLLDGGINDVNFLDVLNPEGPGVEEINRGLERIFRGDLAELITRTRAAFPNAVIVVTGYFPVISESSDRAQLQTMMEFFSRKPEWLIAVNNAINATPPLLMLGFGIVGILALAVRVNTPALISQAVRRTVAAAAYAHFWTRVAIASLPRNVRRPGVVYGYPAFLPDHALFASRPLVHEGYRAENDGEPNDGNNLATDELLNRRLRNIPRLGLLDNYRAISTLITQQRDFPTRSASDLVEGLEMLLAEPDLPGALRRAALATASSVRADSLEALDVDVKSEIARIDVAKIASCLHPNEAGARRYANRIVLAWNRHQRFSLRAALQRVDATALDSVRVRRQLRRHGFDPNRGLRDFAHIAFLESVGIRFFGLRMPEEERSQRRRASSGIPAQVRLGEGLAFSFEIPASAPADYLLAFDTVGKQLTDITTLEFAQQSGLVATFDEIELFLNGRRFLHMQLNQATGRDSRLVFPVSL